MSSTTSRDRYQIGDTMLSVWLDRDQWILSLDVLDAEGHAESSRTLRVYGQQRDADHARDYLADYAAGTPGTDRPYTLPASHLLDVLTAHEAAAALGRKGGSAKSERKTLAVRANARLGGRPRRYIYAAIAQHSGQDAGHVCYGLTATDARAKARQQTTMTVAIRRETATPEQIEALRAVGKL